MSESNYADIVCEQLVGRKALTLMLGAYRFMAKPENKTVSVLIGKGFSNHINAIEVKLEANDTYTLSFYNLNNSNKPPINQYSGVYGGNLKPLVEDELGATLTIPTIL